MRAFSIHCSVRVMWTTPAGLNAHRYRTASGSDRNLLDTLSKHDRNLHTCFSRGAVNDPVASTTPNGLPAWGPRLARGSVTSGKPFFSKMGFAVPKVKC